MHWPFLRVKGAERSMLPALHPGDWLMVWRTRRIRPGQIVLARHPGPTALLIVTRAARRVARGGRASRRRRPCAPQGGPGAYPLVARRPPLSPVPTPPLRAPFLGRTAGGA